MAGHFYCLYPGRFPAQAVHTLLRQLSQARLGVLCLRSLCLTTAAAVDGRSEKQNLKTLKKAFEAIWSLKRRSDRSAVQKVL